MILLEIFLIRLTIGLTKNPSRSVINVILMTKRTWLKAYGNVIFFIDILNLNKYRVLLFYSIHLLTIAGIKILKL